MPLSPAPRVEPRDVVLHIGTGKTGTSSIQVFLHRNRARLAEMGMLVPRSAGRLRHARISLYITPDDKITSKNPWRRQDTSSPAEFRETLERKLFREIRRADAPRVLFSDEALYGSQVDALHNMRTFTDRIARSLRVVVYLRRQDDHVCSRYQQVVKREGEVRRLTDRVRQIDFSHTYDYRAGLGRWEEIVQPGEVVVRPFERERFVEGSLYRDFLDAVGLDGDLDGLESVDVRNESLDAESVEFLRILNVYRTEHEQPAPGYKDNGPLLRRLFEASSGPTLTLPDDELDRFMEQWEESNRSVARDFLGDDSGRLFHRARKTSNTTTEQWLDPARVPYFADLLELPEAIRAPLQKVAEREASLS